MITKKLSRNVSRNSCSKSYWITGIIDRHQSFGGGEIAADLPDTAGNRLAVKRVTHEWIQYFLKGQVVGVEEINNVGKFC